MDTYERKQSLRLKLTQLEDKFPDEAYPKLTIVIPTYNCSQHITVTLESILNQHYPSFEIIVVDGSSTDRTLETIKRYSHDKIRIYSVSNDDRYVMLNKGISQATGLYINFLFPGDFYIYNRTLRHMMAHALEKEKPHMIYCGTLLRDGKKEVKTFFRPLTIDLLKNGQQPSSLQSCWFRADIFREIGKFNPSYKLRGGYELICRLYLNENLKTASTKRFLTDYDLRWVRWRLVFRHFWETFRIVYQYFGLFSLLRWLVVQKEWIRFFKLWGRSLKVALFNAKG
jgi:glycosyltransferase involved in cell wall biosynthesis